MQKLPWDRGLQQHAASAHSHQPAAASSSPPPRAASRCSALGGGGLGGAGGHRCEDVGRDGQVEEAVRLLQLALRLLHPRVQRRKVVVAGVLALRWGRSRWRRWVVCEVRWAAQLTAAGRDKPVQQHGRPSGSSCTAHAWQRSTAGRPCTHRLVEAAAEELLHLQPAVRAVAAAGRGGAAATMLSSQVGRTQDGAQRRCRLAGAAATSQSAAGGKPQHAWKLPCALPPRSTSPSPP